MIKNQWYAVLDSDELKLNKPIGVIRFSEKLVFWRDNDNKINCIFDKCCHRGASLSKGKITENHIECPFHGFQYDSTGKVVLIPANGKEGKIPDNYKVNYYIAKEEYGFIWVWYGDKKEELPQIPFFEELKNGFTYGGFSEVWQVHYTRAIENQLDVVHLPFVHKTTIGKGNKTLVNGPYVEWNDNLMTFYVKNEKDHGQVPLKPKDMAKMKNLFSLQFQMPNLWQNRISEKMRIVAVFAPIDEENTKIYLRTYQKFIKVPIIKDITNSVFNIFNKIVLHQDRRVVLTQLPKKSELKMDENLIQGDLPIIEYRRKRDELRQRDKDLFDN